MIRKFKIPEGATEVMVFNRPGGVSVVFSGEKVFGSIVFHTSMIDTSLEEIAESAREDS